MDLHAGLWLQLTVLSYWSPFVFVCINQSLLILSFSTASRLMVPSLHHVFKARSIRDLVGR